MSKLVKISNLHGNNGTADYKGLDLDKIIAGSQLYPTGENTAYLSYDGTPTESAELEIITQSTYDSVKSLVDNAPKPISIEERISELSNSLKSASQKFAEADKEVVPLTNYKEAKMAQLDELCNLAIVNGFKHTVAGTEYLFSCSLSAQANFTGTDLLFKDGFITEAQWSAIDVSTGKVARVTLTKTEFNTAKLKVFQHINANISKFRNTLQPQVESAKTNSEVDLVKW